MPTATHEELERVAKAAIKNVQGELKHALGLFLDGRLERRLAERQVKRAAGQVVDDPSNRPSRTERLICTEFIAKHGRISPSSTRAVVKRVDVELTHSEVELITAAAKALRLPLSTFMREAALAAAERYRGE